MHVPFLNLKDQYDSIKPDIDAAFARVHSSSSYILGKETDSFELAFASACGTSHCIGVGSGTSAITLLLQANGIGPGDEVITVANTFFATAEAVSQLKAIPILVDCREEDALIDPRRIEAAITRHTKAILPVHLYGQPADMDEIRAIGRYRDLLVFEDACQAHGASYKDKPVGCLGNGAAFSFYPGKNLGAYGDAGAVVTSDDKVARTIRMLRDHGSPEKYRHDLVGWNERMDGLQGATLGVKLPHLMTWNERRSRIVAYVRERLPEAIRPLKLHHDRISSHHLFVVRSPRRDELRTFLADKDIQTGIHYPIPIHLQPAYASRGWKPGEFPVAEKLAREILSLPLYPEMTDVQVEYLVAAIRDFA